MRPHKISLVRFPLLIMCRNGQVSHSILSMPMQQCQVPGGAKKAKLQCSVVAAAKSTNAEFSPREDEQQSVFHY